jgi:hypothetical protein
MRFHRRWLAGLATLLLHVPALAGAQADSVVLRITSPRGAEVKFSGVITLSDGKTERRIENVSTPFEVKLPAQRIDARFRAADGGALSGDIIVYRKGGGEPGRVAGTMYTGDVTLYLDPGRGYGFGPRVTQRPIP